MLRRNARARATTVSEGEDVMTLRQGKASSENPFTAAHMFEGQEPTPLLLKEIVGLQFLLSSKPVFWVAEFVDYGGVDAMIQFISLFSIEYVIISVFYFLKLFFVFLSFLFYFILFFNIHFTVDLFYFFLQGSYERCGCKSPNRVYRESAQLC